MDSVGPDPRDPEGSGAAGSADPMSGGSPPSPGSPPEATATDSAPDAAAAVDVDAPTGVYEVPQADATAPVATEPVEAPPVQLATSDRPPGPRRVSSRVAAVIGIVGVLAIAGVAYAGYSVNQDLTTTRSTLASTETDLGLTRTSLDGATAKLATTTKDLEAATAERGDLDAQIKELSAQVATQTQCVTLQRGALEELVRISDQQTENFNRTAQGSAWDTADKKRADNIDAALKQFYAAYSAAFQGSKGTAKDHADRGKAAQSNIAEAEAQLDAEVALVNTKAGEISVLIDALEKQLTTTQATCEGVAP